MRFLNISFPALAVVTLVACGGGGGDAPVVNAPPVAASPADKYVGAWRYCQAAAAGRTDGIVSASTDFVITKTAAAQLSLSITVLAFTGVGCSGNTVDQRNGSATVKLSGTKLIGGNTVDFWDIQGMSDVPNLDGPGKDIGFISGNTLKLGGEILDAQGYPVALDDTNVFTKR
jgi:hypothetical protein